MADRLALFEGTSYAERIMAIDDFEYGNKRRRKEYTPPVIAADVTGLTVVILSTLALILGETTPIFSFLKSPHPGVEFICRYIAGPYYGFIAGFLPHTGNDWFTIVLFGIAISMMSAVLYAFLAFIIVRFFWKMSKKKRPV